MHVSTDIHPSTVALKYSSWAAALAVIAGVMVLLGWTFDIAVLKSILPSWVSMKANAAVCFILIGVALWLTARSPATFNPQLSTFLFRFARLCRLLTGLIGLMTLGEYIFGWNHGVDQWLFRESSGAVGTTDPGRMAPEAALSFVLLAAALWITGGSRQTRWTILSSAILGLLVTSLALASMLSYPTPGLGSYGWFGLSIMAMHTAILFSVLGIVVIATSWRQDVLPWSLNRNTAAAFACGMAVLVLIGFNANRSQYWLGETNRQIAYNEVLLASIRSVATEIIEAQAHALGYVITGDERLKPDLLEAKAISNAKLDALRKRITGNPHQQQQFARIEVQVKTQLEWFQQVIDANRASMTVVARNNMVSHGEDLQSNLRITLDQIESEYHQFIQQLKQDTKSVSRISYLIISLGTLVSLMIFLTEIFMLNFAVSELKRAEKTLRASRENLDRLLNSMAEGAYGLDTKGNCTFVNLPFLQTLGFQNDGEVLGKHLHELIHHSHADGSPYPDSECRVYRAYRTNQTSNVSDEVLWRKDGIAIPVEYWSHPIVSDGVVTGAIVTFIDITERKNAIAAMREKELLLSESQRIAHVGSWRFELTGHLIWSDETYRIYGVSPDTFTPNVEYLLHLIHPADRLAMQEWISTCVAGQKPGKLEFRICPPDGTERVIRGFGELQYDALNRPSHLIGIVHDITERKQAEEAIRKQQELTTQIIETIPLRIFWKDHGLRFLGCNTLFAKDAGLSRPEEIIGKTDFDMSWKDQAELYHADDQRVMDSNTPKLSYDEPQTTPDGGQIWLRTSKAPLRNKVNETIGVLGIYEDITTYKQVESRLRESEDRFRKAFQNSAIGMALVGLDGHWLKVNNSLCQILGYSEKELLDRTFQDITHPDDLQSDLDFIAQLLAGKIDHYQMESRYFHKDGHVVWIHLSVSLIRDAQDSPIHFIFQIEDITQFKQAQDAMHVSRENLHRLHNSMAEGAYGVDTNGDCTFVNRAFLQMLGYQNEAEVLGKHIHELIHHSHADGSTYPANECKAYHAFRINQSINVSDEVFWRKDGVAVPVEYRSHPIESDGVELGAIVTFVDITVRKQEEAKLAEQLVELRRWHNITSGREGRILDLKHEVNELLAKTGQPPRYPSAESQDQTKK
jgi:PAS domain S-box-containing protein